MKALIVVDLQNDFCPGGALAVNEGDKIVSIVNDLMASKKYDLIVATKDWHPENHKSFASNNPGAEIGSLGSLNGQPQVMWPDHCVQGSAGAEFHPHFLSHLVAKIFNKGENKEVDSYSGFFDNDKKSSTGLGEYLKSKGVEQVDIVGLALDYCVKATALDAHTMGFKTRVLLNGTRAVNLHPQDGQRAIEELKNKGVKTV